MNEVESDAVEFAEWIRKNCYRASKEMDKQSIIELQKIDCNCNDCKFMVRDFDKMKSWDYLHIGQEKASHRVNYGNCIKLNKTVSFLPNTCQLNTQECFEHRRIIQPLKLK